jgi:hypothetical protein
MVHRVPYQRLQQHSYLLRSPPLFRGWVSHPPHPRRQMNWVGPTLGARVRKAQETCLCSYNEGRCMWCSGDCSRNNRIYYFCSVLFYTDHGDSRERKKRDKGTKEERKQREKGQNEREKEMEMEMEKEKERGGKRKE